MFFKRFLSVMLCVAMLMCFTIPVAADDISAIKYGAGESFIIIIPGGFCIGASGKALADITVKDVMISHGSVLKVFVSGDDYNDSWEMINITNDSSKLTYTIGMSEGASDVKNNSVILYVNAGETVETTETIYFTISDKSIASGYYNDVLTFVVDVE